MDNRIIEVTNIDKSKTGVLSDISSIISLTNQTRELPDSDIITVLDVNKQFNRERQDCKTYRLLGQIKPLVSNVLFDLKTDIHSENTLETFNNTNFRIAGIDDKKDMLSYAESIKKHLKEVDGWFGYFNPDINRVGLCNFTDMSPTREQFNFDIDKNTGLTNNWDLTASYPYSADTTQHLINGGLLIIDKIKVVVAGKPMLGLIIPVVHNLSISDSIVITGTNIDGQYEIKRLGDDDGEFSDYICCIDVDDASLTDSSRLSKIIDGNLSKYYFRLFKKLKSKNGILENDDYEIFKLGFSETIFGDDTYKFIFNEEIDTSGLYDNLNRPISEISLTITNKNTNFTEEILGIETPYFSILEILNPTSKLYDLPTIHSIHTSKTSNKKSFLHLPKTSVDVFYGDIVEYNDKTMIEYIISDVNARINTKNRELETSSLTGGNRLEGYYYQKHYKIKLKDYSEYLEFGNKTIDEIPDYATNLGFNNYSWRDLLDIGLTIDTDYPYTNGHHYIYTNIDFEVKRQDPFSYWGLYHKDFPSDQLGNVADNNFKLKYSQNVC